MEVCASTLTATVCLETVADKRALSNMLRSLYLSNGGDLPDHTGNNVFVVQDSRNAKPSVLVSTFEAIFLVCVSVLQIYIHWEIAESKELAELIHQKVV